MVAGARLLVPRPRETCRHPLVASPSGQRRDERLDKQGSDEPQCRRNAKRRGASERRFRAGKEGNKKRRGGGAVQRSKATPTLVPVVGLPRPPYFAVATLTKVGSVRRHAAGSAAVSGHDGLRRSAAASSARSSQLRLPYHKGLFQRTTSAAGLPDGALARWPAHERTCLQTRSRSHGTKLGTSRVGGGRTPVVRSSLRVGIWPMLANIWTAIGQNPKQGPTACE